MTILKVIEKKVTAKRKVKGKTKNIKYNDEKKGFGGIRWSLCCRYGK